MQLSKKLFLSKETIAKLNENQGAAIVGGATGPCIVPTVINCPTVTKCASFIITQCHNAICDSYRTICDCS